MPVCSNQRAHARVVGVKEVQLHEEGRGLLRCFLRRGRGFQGGKQRPLVRRSAFERKVRRQQEGGRFGSGEPLVRCRGIEKLLAPELICTLRRQGERNRAQSIAKPPTVG